MNSIFFLLPFILVVSIGIYHDATAQEVITGYNYFDIKNPDGSGGELRSHHPYVLDSNNNYVPFINSGLQTTSHLGTVTLNTDGTYSWNGKFTDKIVAKYADVSDLNSWTYLNTLNNDTPDLSWSNEEFSNIKQSAAGILNYKYIFDNGKWKTQLEATNLSGLTTKAFGFDQIIDLNSDTIKFGGITRNLDNFDGVTFDKEFLDNNEGKILDLLNGINFDFDLGYENLYSITVHDTGVNKSRLVFDYRTSTPLLPNETLVIDPTFTDTTSSDGRVISTTSVSASCSATLSSKDTSSVQIEKAAAAANGACLAGWIEFDISGAATDWTVTSASLEYDVTTANNSPTACTWRETTVQPSSGSGTTLLANAMSGTAITASDSGCTTVADGKTIALNGDGITSIQTAIDASQSWYGVAVFFTDQTRGASQVGAVIIRSNDAVLSITYNITPTPDAVTDLTSLTQSYGTVDLSWTEPNLNTGNVSGYQINYTTPYGNPLTVITNNTGTSTTLTSVTGLSTGTPYTFGVSVWTEGGNNATHPPMTWFNITTAGNFTIGTSTFNQTNPFVLPITFEEQTIDDTTEFLNVTFSNTFNLACDFHYKFANTNQTYINLTSYPVSSTLDETSFIFTNGTNEIIDVYCWDQLTDTNARYLLKQTDFPILDQILGFRSGDYGTQGMFGVFDLVTLLVIIGSMIGLNRENESVGIVFNVMLMFALSFFGIIQLTTVIFGMIALVLVFVITSTKKS